MAVAAMSDSPPLNAAVYESKHPNKKQYTQAGETYEDASSSTSLASKQSSTASGSQRDEMEKEVAQIEVLPMELSRLVDMFVDDLKQPKYVKPLSIFLLSGLFQQFYTRFDASCGQYLAKQGRQLGTSASVENVGFSSARETLSTGLGGIFGRSRSGSGPHKKRSSSLFGNDAANSQPLSPEEVQRHLKLQELNSMKIERYMDICERDVFQKIMEVGTSVPGTGQETERRPVHAVDLFRNSPEFLEYDSLLTAKIRNLRVLVERGVLDLPAFLGMPRSEGIDCAEFGIHLQTLVEERLSPMEKLAQLLAIHDKMTFLKDASSNDDYLSMLLYVIILTPVHTLYLNVQFIKLFRYSRKLMGSEQYAVTNMTAALYFLENLTINDLPGTAKGHAKPSDIFVLSHRVKLPDISRQAKPELPRTNSYKSLMGTTLDNSLRNIFGKIKSYTPPAPAQTVFSSPTNQSNMHNNQLNCCCHAGKPCQGQIGSAQLSSTAELACCNDSHDSFKGGENSKRPLHIPECWRQLQNRDFDDLKVSELKQVFDAFQKLLHTLEH
ncbi:FAEL239Wp [Eremothecium gossypii FDAG1]|nr:FAEL239Wp [Eremothecium gossypii FDAG1]